MLHAHLYARKADLAATMAGPSDFHVLFLREVVAEQWKMANGVEGTLGKGVDFRGVVRRYWVFTASESVAIDV